jgi:hypothetical protein
MNAKGEASPKDVKIVAWASMVMATVFRNTGKFVLSSKEKNDQWGVLRELNEQIIRRA